MKPIYVQHIDASMEYRQLNDKRLPEKFSAIREKPFVLFVGGRSGYKNFEFAVRAIEQAPQYTLVVVGGGVFSDSENSLVSSLDGRCVHYASLNNDELNLLYNNAHALLYPSSYEGFGIPLLEAMRAGCPAIGLNASSIPEVIGTRA